MRPTRLSMLKQKNKLNKIRNHLWDLICPAYHISAISATANTWFLQLSWSWSSHVSDQYNMHTTNFVIENKYFLKWFCKQSVVWGVYSVRGNNMALWWFKWPWLEGITVSKSSSFCNIEFQTHHSIPWHKHSLLCPWHRITWQLCHNLCEASERPVSPATFPLLSSWTAIFHFLCSRMGKKRILLCIKRILFPCLLSYSPCGV